jgi:hypothetical protein
MTVLSLVTFQEHYFLFVTNFYGASTNMERYIHHGFINQVAPIMQGSSSRFPLPYFIHRLDNEIYLCHLRFIQQDRLGRGGEPVRLIKRRKGRSTRTGRTSSRGSSLRIWSNRLVSSEGALLSSEKGQKEPR